MQGARGLRWNLVVTALVTAGLVVGTFAAALSLARSELVRSGDESLNPHGHLVGEVSRPGTGAHLVFFLGDSTFGIRPKVSYPKMLARRLGDRVELRAVWAPGMGPAEHYLLMGRALALEPEIVVILAHLRMLWGSEPLWYPDLLPLLPPRELRRALALPFHARGVGAGRLVLASAFGTLRRDDWMYAFVGGTELAREAPVLRWLSPPRFDEVAAPDPDGRAELRTEHIERYGEPLHEGHSALAMIGASVEMAERRGARAVVLVSPVPVDQLLEAGVYHEAGVEQRVELVRDVVLRNGGEVLDLHQALGPDDFRDALGHYSEPGARRVADAVEVWLREALSIPPDRRLRRGRRP